MKSLVELNLNDNALCRGLLLDESTTCFDSIEGRQEDHPRLPYSLEGFGGGLVKLELLAMKQNFIETLPKSFSELKCLHFLDLSRNCLSEFPDAISFLPELESLLLKVLP